MEGGVVLLVCVDGGESEVDWKLGGRGGMGEGEEREGGGEEWEIHDRLKNSSLSELRCAVLLVKEVL